MKSLSIGHLSIPKEEIKWSTSRAGGPGGQHVNKVSSAVRLQFDILHSSLPDDLKVLLLQTKDGRITKKGKFSIRVSKYRSQVKNKSLALARFVAFIEDHLKPKKKRIPTKISKSTKAKRRQEKKHKSDKKAARRKIVL